MVGRAGLLGLWPCPSGRCRWQRYLTAFDSNLWFFIPTIIHRAKA